MILKENKTYLLRENHTGAENAECRFRCWFGEEEAEFFFDVSDENIVSPFTQDNEDIWKGDAVEVFLSPDGSLSRYYELEVSPFGVRFWGEVTFPRGKKKLQKLPPPFTAQAACTQGGYTVHIRLPLAALEGFDRGAVRLNAFRVDKKPWKRLRLYALNPTRCKTFHKPECLLSKGADERR